MAFQGWAVSFGKDGLRGYSGLLDVFSLDTQRYSGEDEKIVLFVFVAGQ
jgi:hypothetical protein